LPETLGTIGPVTSPAPEQSERTDFERVLDSGATAGEIREPIVRGSRLDDWWQSLDSTPTRRRLWAWGGPAIVVLIAALTRLVNLGHPSSLVFDETFYVKDAWSLWNLGYSADWPAETDPRFNAGDVDIYTDNPSFVVHPPLGKILIGFGMFLFGPQNPVSWRISTAIIGILAVVILMIVAKLLFRSTLLATIAGLLFAIDGNAIVMSRVALLDNYVMFFALLGFLFIVLDRGFSERRLRLWLKRREDADRSTDWGPSLWWRPWLLAAAAAFGLCSAVKWNGIFFLAAFAVYSVVVDALARRRAGVLFWGTGTLVKQAPVSFLLTIPLALVVHMTTWISWFASQNSYDRQWANTGSNAWTGFFEWVPRSIQSWLHFQQSVYNYNIGEVRPHPYQANPLTWLFMTRPTSMYWQSSTEGQNGCTFAECGESITGIANPIIWWAATVAVLYLVYRLVRFREWRVGLVLMGVAAGYLPWMMYLHRTVFQFYTIAFEPYLILALTMAIGYVLGSRRDPSWRRQNGIGWVAVFLFVTVGVSVFFWPLWSGMQFPIEFIRLHWWLPGWR